MGWQGGEGWGRYEMCEEARTEEVELAGAVMISRQQAL